MKKLTKEEFLERLWDKNEHYRNGEFEVVSECFKLNPLVLYNNLEGFYNEDKINIDKIMCEEHGIDYEQQFYIN